VRISISLAGFNRYAVNITSRRLANMARTPSASPGLSSTPRVSVRPTNTARLFFFKTAATPVLRFTDTIYFDVYLASFKIRSRRVNMASICLG